MPIQQPLLESDLFRYYRNGLTALNLSNGAAETARQNFDYCIDRCGGGDYYDVWYALALTVETVPDRIVEQLYRTRHTAGDLMSLLARQPLSEQLQMTLRELVASVDIAPPFGVDVNLAFPDGSVAAMMALRTRAGHYEEALDLAKTADNPDHQAILLATAHLYYQAQRWPQVIEYAQPLLNALVLGPDGAPYRDEHGRTYEAEQWQSAARVMIGASQAHLGQFTAARNILRKVSPRFEKVGAWSLYLLGAIARLDNDENLALSHWSDADQVHLLQEVADARRSKDVVLRQSNEAMISARSSYWDPSTEPDLATVRAREFVDQRSSLLAEAEAELDKFVGMEQVRARVDKLKYKALYDAEAERREMHEMERGSMHLIFKGPPGTGKTEVARVIGKIMCGVGQVATPNVKETSRRDFVGDTDSSSAGLTAATVEAALDGVLFIDEAYTLKQKRGYKQEDSFGQEAIDTLLKLMEDNRHRLVVIIAGYAKEIDEFLESNPGLRGRFTHTIEFTSYEPEVIWEIARLYAERRGDILVPEAETMFLQAAQGLRAMKNHNDRLLIDEAGNARFARNVIEEAESNRAVRIGQTSMSDIDDVDMRTVTVPDLREAMRESLRHAGLSERDLDDALKDIHVPENSIT